MRQNVDRRSRQPSGLQMLSQNLVIYHKAAAQVDQARSGLHRLDFFLAKQALIRRLAVDV